MNVRLLVGIGGLVLLLVASGCLGGATDESSLSADAEYDWDTDATVTIDLDDSTYTAVMEIEETEELRVYQSDRYGRDYPVGVRAVQFRYPNGTIVNASAIDVRETRNSVYIEPPAENGTIAYTAPKQSKEFSSPAIVSGDWEVIVPESHRVDNFVLATVRPRDYDAETTDGRTHLTWEEVSGDTVRVRYYLARDLYLFGGLVVAAIIAAGIGMGYVYREIQALQRKRAELGLDLDQSDDFDSGPPPGMR